MKSSMERPPDQAGRELEVVLEGWDRGVDTGEDESALLSEDVAVILPFGGIAVDGPAFAKLGDAVAVEDLFEGAVDVDIGVWLGFFLGDVVHLDDLFVRLLISSPRMNSQIPRGKTLGKR